MPCRKLFLGLAGVAAMWLLPACVNLHAQDADANPLQLSIDHATIVVADLDKESHWYQHVLGFREDRRADRGPGRVVAYLTIPGYRLDLVQQQGSGSHAKGTGNLEQGWLNIVFKTPAIEAAYQKLVAQGASVKVDRNAQGVMDHLTFQDPEGNEIGIAPARMQPTK
jgi:catechol 2,3-dioxygenase-like lactoylglutathione lyase family enzyme